MNWKMQKCFQRCVWTKSAFSNRQRTRVNVILKKIMEFSDDLGYFLTTKMLQYYTEEQQLSSSSILNSLVCKAENILLISLQVILGL